MNWFHWSLSPYDQINHSGLNNSNGLWKCMNYYTYSHHSHHYIFLRKSGKLKNSDLAQMTNILGPTKIIIDRC